MLREIAAVVLVTPQILVFRALPLGFSQSLGIFPSPRAHIERKLRIFSNPRGHIEGQSLYSESAWNSSKSRTYTGVKARDFSKSQSLFRGGQLTSFRNPRVLYSRGNSFILSTCSIILLHNYFPLNLFLLIPHIFHVPHVVLFVVYTTSTINFVMCFFRDFTYGSFIFSHIFQILPQIFSSPIRVILKISQNFSKFRFLGEKGGRGLERV